MKLIRLATVAALTTTILAGGAAGAFADEVRDVETNGQIEFTPSENEELEVVPPESDPDVEIEPEIPGTTGPLSIVKAAHMNSGKQVISNQDKTYNMVAEMQQLRGTEDDDNKVPYVSFAQVQDVRGNNAGWDLKVSMTDFTSQTQNNVLTGAEIEFVDSRIQYEGIDQTLAPFNHSAGLILRPNNVGISVMTAETEKGAGVSSVVWGDQEDLNVQFEDDEIEVVENDSIRLSVPGSTAKDATTYQSTLTWELATTPGENAGEAI